MNPRKLPIRTCRVCPNQFPARIRVGIRGRYRQIYCSKACAMNGINDVPPEVRSQRGREGGRARHAGWEHAMLESLRDLPFREAVIRAYLLGRSKGYRDRYRERDADARRAAA